MRRRPLVDAMTIRKGKRKGEGGAVLREDTRRRLEWLGRERELIYKMLVLTGLRRGELASLTIGQLDLDADPAFLVLNAADEKNREGSTIPLRGDLAADLRQWLADKATARQDAARNAPTLRIDSQPVDPGKRATTRIRRREGRVCQGATTLPRSERLFDIPTGLVRILDRDLKAAGIAKRDERGRTVDLHAMRHTFGTLLSKNGVTPRTAQAAMRHSDVNLTMNTYTDPKLLDVAGAMESLPSLPLGGGPQPDAAAVSATGTDNSTPAPFAPGFAPGFAPATGKPCILGSILDKATETRVESIDAGAVAVSACPVNAKSPLTGAVNGLRPERVTGLGPATSSLGSTLRFWLKTPESPRIQGILAISACLASTRTKPRIFSRNRSSQPVQNGTNLRNLAASTLGVRAMPTVKADSPRMRGRRACAPGA